MSADDLINLNSLPVLELSSEVLTLLSGGFLCPDSIDIDGE